MKKNEIIPFGYDDQLVRTVMIDDAPWFVARDVCKILGISKYRDAVASLDEDEGCPVEVDTLGGVQKMSAINESGLYTLIMRSNKPEAKRFRKWVTAEVLPSIRKTGQYGNSPELVSRLAKMENALEGLAEFKSAVLKMVGAPKVVEYRTVTSQLDEDIYNFYKKHIDDTVPSVFYTKAIDVWELFKYDTPNKYSKADFMGRFKSLYQQFAFGKHKNVDVFWGFRLIDTCGVC